MSKTRSALLLAIICPLLAVGQPQSKHAVELSTDYLMELYPHAYHYRATNIQATYRYEFVRAKWGSLYALASLHVAPTSYSAVAFPTDDYRRGIELGVTGGVIVDINLYKDYLGFYLGGFIGPMYTPNMPARQGGFINFSDNLCFGFNVKLYDGWYVDLRGGFRHLSNAGLFRPNYGLNTPYFGVGLIANLCK